MAIETAGMIVYIYTLSDPRTDMIFYVGSTITPKKRLYKHKLNARQKKHPNRKDVFIRDMIASGYSPEMKIIEETTDDIAFSREFHWIELLTRNGVILLNQQDLSNRLNMKQSRGRQSRPDITTNTS